MLKELWNFWIDFTEFRAIRKCYLDEMLYGNSYKIKRWWGWQRISPLQFMDTKTVTTGEEAE